MPPKILDLKYRLPNRYFSENCRWVPLAYILVFLKLQCFVPRNLEEANVKFSLKLQNRSCCGVAIVQVSVLMKRRHVELLSVQSAPQRSISSVQVAEVAVS